jgi:hypothetical protein
MDSSVFSGPSLGTLLKNYIIKQCGITPVGSTEWFSVEANAAWKLFESMQSWDTRKLVTADKEKIERIIQTRLG